MLRPATNLLRALDGDLEAIDVKGQRPPVKKMHQEMAWIGKGLLSERVLCDDSINFSQLANEDPDLKPLSA